MTRCPIACALGATLALSSTIPVNAHDHAEAPGRARVQYVANRGQWPQQVLFKASFPNSAMFLQRNAITWSRYQSDASERMHEYIQWPEEQQASFSLKGHAWRVHFVGANLKTGVRGEHARPEYHNYFLGNDQSKWASRVPVFESVHYEDLWPGIDMHWHSAEGQLKYDLLLDAGADASTIRFRYEALDGLGVDNDGNLVMRTSVGDLTELKPVAWYADDDSPLVCRFEVDGDEVGFSFPKGIDSRRAVVIDPTLMGATYSGQTGASNYGHCSTFDNAGNMYGGAQNFGNNFPATLGAFQTSPAGGSGTDIVVNKFTPDAASLIWATFLGSTSDDKPHSMIVNSNDELCILGSSTGAGFPTTTTAFDATHNGSSDIVLVHLNSTATALIGSTYLGGSAQDGRQSMTTNYGDTYRGEIMVDAQLNIWIAGSAQSADFPTTAGAFQTAFGGGQDAVVVGVSPDCSTLLMSTFIGGSAQDSGLGLRFDAAGDIYVCGGTEGSNFPMPTGGWQATYLGGPRDGYVVKLSGSTLTAGTYFGTASSDQAYFLDLDSEGDVYIYGQTQGTLAIEPTGIFGIANGGVFVASFDPALTAPIFTTTVGPNMAPVAFLVDECDHIYVSGYNPSGTWTTTADALYSVGGNSFYLACYDNDMGSILFGTYYGGSHVDGGTSRFDKRGVVYQGVCSGGQSMPTTPGAYAPTNNVGWDLGVFKIDFEQLLSVGIDAGGVGACTGAPVTLTGTGDATTWSWDLAGAVIGTDQSITYTFNEPGTYTITLIGSATGFCEATDTTTLELEVVDPLVMEAGFTADPLVTCSSFEIDLANSSTGSTTYFWDLGNGTTSTLAEPVAVYDSPGDYIITLLVIDAYCGDTVTLSRIIVLDPPDTTVVIPSPLVLCDGSSVNLTAPGGYDTYTWSTGQNAQVITVEETGTYWVDVTFGYCEASDTSLVLPQQHFPPMADRKICPEDATSFGPSFTPQQILWSTGDATVSISTDQPGLYSFIATDPDGCTVMDTVEVQLNSIALGDPILPNVFTPNGDKMNEEFRMINIDPEGYRMDIYNRWGMKVFSTGNSNVGWNGKLDNMGETVPDGTYFVIVTYNAYCRQEDVTTLTGHVTLLR
ncbi:MAG: gliding motility-associated C-terminal domain-containing protein [Flavobacteriales bacterium]|nr:gliding motility-associated C-terminal domain-containing protein [Flavobacteriales bacterium]